jgi:Na+/H+ antiporter NhaD/arsenite permease-like protein
MTHAFYVWAFVIAALLVVFWALDRRAFRHQPAQVQELAEQPDIARFAGWINVALMAGVVGAVFIPGDIPWLREGVMLAAAGLSLRFTPKIIHKINAFTFGPVREVAVLFFGIFLTMMPALEYVAAHGKDFGLREPMQFYATTGALSAVLDNAPTYATFFGLATVASREASPEAFMAADANRAQVTAAVLTTTPGLVVAVSLGAVFFGAMTYIGNGPNFMVKAIAEEAGVKMPSFFGYLARFALPVLLPILLLAGWIFL